VGRSEFDIARKTGDMVVMGCLAGFVMALFWMLVGFGVDAVSTQLLLWGLGSMHVIAGFWGTAWIVGSLETIVAATTFGVIKLIK